MKGASYPYNQDLLYSIKTLIPHINFGNWQLAETNLLFVINKDCDIYITAQILFQERRNRVLKRKNDFFWILIVKDKLELEKFSSEKSILGFWDVFCIIEKEFISSYSRSIHELVQSVKKIGNYAS